MAGAEEPAKTSVFTTGFAGAGGCGRGVAALGNVFTATRASGTGGVGRGFIGSVFVSIFGGSTSGCGVGTGAGGTTRGRRGAITGFGFGVSTRGRVGANNSTVSRGCLRITFGVYAAMRINKAMKMICTKNPTANGRRLEGADPSSVNGSVRAGWERLISGVSGLVTLLVTIDHQTAK